MLRVVILWWVFVGGEGDVELFEGDFEEEVVLLWGEVGLEDGDLVVVVVLLVFVLF